MAKKINQPPPEDNNKKDNLSSSADSGESIAKKADQPSPDKKDEKDDPFSPEKEKKYEQDLSVGHTKEVLYSTLAHAMLLGLILKLSEQVITHFQVLPDDPTPSVLGISYTGLGVMGAFAAAGLAFTYKSMLIGTRLATKRDDRHAKQTAVQMENARSVPEPGKDVDIQSVPEPDKDRENRRLRRTMRKLTDGMKALEEQVAKAIKDGERVDHAHTPAEHRAAEVALAEDVAIITETVKKDKKLADEIDKANGIVPPELAVASEIVPLELAVGGEKGTNTVGKWAAGKSASGATEHLTKSPRTPGGIIETKDNPPEERSEHYIG